MTLQDLQARLEVLRAANAPEARGLAVFIQLAQRLPPGTSVMGKIQRSFVDLAARERIAKATTFEQVVEAIGPNYQVSLERS